MEKKDIWRTVLSSIQLELSDAIFKTWFSGTNIYSLKKNSVEVSCDLKYKKDLLEERYYGLIKRNLEEVLGRKVELSIIVNLENKPIKEPLGPLFDIEKTEEDRLNKKYEESGLFRDFNFDNYVIGPNNRLAYAVAEAIVENPGSLYNPFFLYSGVGLGKTHLIQAIGNAILTNKKSVRVLYRTGETFTNELIESIQQRSTAAKFRNKFRNVDVLLIDDVQFIAGRESTQEEFFHTFNSLHMAKKQIILASDRPPKDIARLEERLSSRFASGMIADLQSPDVDIRNAILRNKRSNLKVAVSDEVIDYISQNVTSNVRELEGVFVQIITFAKTLDEEISLDIAKRVVGDSRQISSKTNLNDILKTVAEYYSIKVSELKGSKRPKSIVVPRQIAMFLIRSINETPLMTIGDALGGRDHSTILHGINKVEKELLEDPKVRQDIKNLRQNLNI